MRKLITISLIFISILLILSGCSNHAFKVVATTVNPTPKQKGLLAIACNNQFGKSEPIFVKGETITKVDTIFSTDSALIEVIKTLPCIYNYDSLLKVIKASIKPVIINTTAETTNKYVAPDKAREYLLESQIRDKENVISNLQNKSEQDDEIKARLRRNGLIVTSLFTILLVAIFVRIYLKLKSKIIGLS